MLLTRNVHFVREQEKSVRTNSAACSRTKKCSSRTVQMFANKRVFVTNSAVRDEHEKCSSPLLWRISREFHCTIAVRRRQRHAAMLVRTSIIVRTYWFNSFIAWFRLPFLRFHSKIYPMLRCIMTFARTRANCHQSRTLRGWTYNMICTRTWITIFTIISSR